MKIKIQEDYMCIKRIIQKIAYGSKTKDNGDLTDVKTISLFKKDMKKNKKWADIVSADGGFKWQDENMQEQEAYALLLGEIVAAISVQAKDGSFVLKLFESFTDLTLKMIYWLHHFTKNHIF